MDASNGPSKNTLLMMFGLPIVTTFIVCTSMYVGHILTKKMDRPTQVVVQPSTPQISFTAPAPAVNVMPSTAQVTVIERQNQLAHQAQQVNQAERLSDARPMLMSKPAERPIEKVAEKTVEKSTEKQIEKPAELKPVPLSKPVERSTKTQIPLMLQKPRNSQIKIEAGEPTSETRTLKPAAPVVAKAPVSKPAPVAASATVVAEAPATPTNGNSTVAAADVRPAPAPVVVTPKPNVPPPQPMITASASRTTTPAVTSNHSSGTTVSRDANEGRLILASAPRTAASSPVSSSSSAYLLGRAVRDEELNLDVFYTLCRKYVDAYCVKMGLNPHEEHAKWTKRWNANLEQALYDGSDSSEQQYINRQTISKRDCFNIEKSSAEKIAEGCRILLRYRDGGFTWLSAMTNALTQENLRKTIDFLNAGPRL